MSGFKKQEDINRFTTILSFLKCRCTCSKTKIKISYMRSHFLTAAFFFLCSSFSNDGYHDESLLPSDLSAKNIFGLTVRRLSGERVMITWHTEEDPQGIIYEVLRKHKTNEQFTSLGVVSPELKQGLTADYSFVDANGFADSSFYCLKKINVDSVIFYSITRGVEGVGRER
jgi:hypothetical protein